MCQVRISLTTKLTIDRLHLSAKVIVTEKTTDLKIRAIITLTAGTNTTMIETGEMFKYIPTNMKAREVVNVKENQAYKINIKSDNRTFNQLILEIHRSLYRVLTTTNNTTKIDHFNVSQVTFSLLVITTANKCRKITVNAIKAQVNSSLTTVLTITLHIISIENNSKFQLCNTNPEGLKRSQNLQCDPAFKPKRQHRVSKAAMVLVKAGWLRVINSRQRNLNRYSKRYRKPWSMLPIKLLSQYSSKFKCSPNWIKKY